MGPAPGGRPGARRRPEQILGLAPPLVLVDRPVDNAVDNSVEQACGRAPTERWEKEPPARRTAGGNSQRGNELRGTCVSRETSRPPPGPRIKVGG